MSNANGPGAYVAQGVAAEALLDAIFEATNDAILLFDNTGGLVRASERALTVLGYAKDDVSALRFADLVEDVGGLAGDSGAASALPRLRHRGGALLALNCSVRRVAVGGFPLTLCIGCSAPEDASAMAFPHGARPDEPALEGFDASTNLPARAAMPAMVMAELERGRVYGRPVAVLALDIAHFGQITAAQGRRIGDEIVRRCAEELRTALRTQDHLARDGEDSFLALLPGASASEASAIVERLRHAVEGTTFAIGAAALRLHLNAGMAVYPADGVDAPSLIRHAQSTRRRMPGPMTAPHEPLESAEVPRHFALAVSHELRTPLTTILGSAEVLLHGWARLDDAARRKGVERLLSGARRLDLLVRDLLLVVGLEQGRLTVSPIETGLTPLLDQAIYDASAAHPNLDLRARGLRGAPPVWADPDRVIQVLMHLIDNAARHGQGAGPPELRVEARPDEVEIRVTDRGPGLPDEGRVRLFTRFGKLSQNPHAGRIGTGLGLYISRLLVEAMGGAIGVESIAGKGASFWFTLPRTGTRIHGTGTGIHGSGMGIHGTGTRIHDGQA